LLAGVRLSGELFNGAATDVVTYGPSVARTAGLALAWGICGGAVGGLIARAADARADRGR
jgi:hypothetical protein